ncbi:hypothetical protein LCGC14_1824790 [marine sediment metagenome]|uniref:Uncharacterized protein n=1 Tax=marine sediment metagenome TaxID=412755 RepID=A0A0F9JHC8_9ZZZZ
MCVVVSNLYLIENEEDDCWEIIERNGICPEEDEVDDDAIVAKFYVAPELAEFLLNMLREKGIKTSEEL